MAVSTHGTVWLEGVEMKDVFSFNIAEGWVECYTTSPSRYCNKDCSVGDVMASRLYGRVEFMESNG